LYNLYNSPSTLPALHDYLSQHQDIEHIVLGDFNLHHPFWGGIARPLQHRMADQLLDLVGHFALDLATPVGTRTRSGKGQESTIDLAFTTSSITPIIEHCYTRDELD
jgi:hypothetical protein